LKLYTYANLKQEQAILMDILKIEKWILNSPCVPRFTRHSVGCSRSISLRYILQLDMLLKNV